MRVGKLAAAKTDAALELVELSCTRLSVLHQLEQSGKALPLGDLAQCLQFAKSNATQVADQLEARDLVRRIPQTQDRRSIQLELTEQGKAKHQEAVTALSPLAEKILLAFSAEERAQFESYLQRVSSLLE